MEGDDSTSRGEDEPDQEPEQELDHELEHETEDDGSGPSSAGAHSIHRYVQSYNYFI